MHILLNWLIQTSPAPAPRPPLAPDGAAVPPTVLQVASLPADLTFDRAAALAVSMLTPLPSTAVHEVVTSAPDLPRPSERRTPRDAAAGAGMSIGASSKAGTGTAGVFTRFGEKIAGSFRGHSCAFTL